jgi:nucleoside-diphosphate-sugar epimerase
MISGKKVPILYDTTKPEGDMGRCADYSKAKMILNWSPKVSMVEGLTRLYSWIFLRNKVK